ncbi:MAG TPA: hypothetical protein VFA59_02010 [Vicinamibacterales bacterium]|nr:hypothetical protein [Vicinamibacterales bacterium]
MLVTILALLLGVQSLDTLSFMQGKWIGEGTSEMGAGAGYFTFEPDLAGKIWVRRNHAEYPGQNGAKPAVHDDLMIVYLDGASTRAFYTDTEGHVIPYVVSMSADEQTVTFISEPQPKQPRYRLTYVRLEPGRMTVTLEMAQPDHPDQFSRIVEGRVRKTP